MSLVRLIGTAATLLGVASAWPHQRRDIDNTQPLGTNPIGQFSVQYLGEQISDNSCSHRDLGFAGQLAVRNI